MGLYRTLAGGKKTTKETLEALKETDSERASSRPYGTTFGGFF